jgi:hypothetical protein
VACCCGSPLCNCQSGSVPLSILMTVPSASLLFSPGTGAVGSVGYDELRNGGSCVDDSGLVDWLKSISITLTSNGTNLQWNGSGTFSSPWGDVLVTVSLSGQCSGSLSYSMTYCPLASSEATCIRFNGPDVGAVSGSGTLCQFISARNATGFFAQQIATFNSNSSPSCRLGPGGFVSSRGFSVSLRFEPSALP